MQLNTPDIQAAWQKARGALLEARGGKIAWTGKLAASALSTATAVVALALAQRHRNAAEPKYDSLIASGLDWLADNVNADGGWGDTVHSRSNISTTVLVWAALAIAPNQAAKHRQTISAAEAWLTQLAGSTDPERLAEKILERYASDRTFSVPILTHCALAGQLGPETNAWKRVIPLPFELAVLPPNWFATLQLPVVSYALPALIAVGYVRHVRMPSANPLLRLLRSLAGERALRVLASVQPPNGGFLEAIPLTSFVVMSLLGSGKPDHIVVARGLDFIAGSARADGAWQIDTNLSTWVTTLAIHAMASQGELGLKQPEQHALCDWMLRQQYRQRHPYTNAAPGGWAWTNLPGGVPDADDTAGALLALKLLRGCEEPLQESASAGIQWLLNLQNRDGGIPTFCRGWGKLPFDRSSADLSAHALRAWAAWRDSLDPKLQRRVNAAMRRAVRFLEQAQEECGAWCPLWFGNESEPDEVNRVYGTSRVVLALAETNLCPEAAAKGAKWLASAQRQDGGWSGGSGPGPVSIEETAVALEALCAAAEAYPVLRRDLMPAINSGTARLAAQVAEGNWTRPAAIGFYFAKLWYFEELYPLIFTVAALGRALRLARA